MQVASMRPGKTVKGKTLANYPYRVAQLHPTENGGISPDQIPDQQLATLSIRVDAEKKILRLVVRPYLC